MKKLIIFCVALQVLPVFAASSLSTEQAVCTKYGCTTSNIETQGVAK